MRNFCFIFALVVVMLFSAVRADWYSSPDDKDPESCPASCLEPKDEGNRICWRRQNRWHFETDSKTCEPFKFTGCGGNSNNFQTRKACMEKCVQCTNRDDEQLAAAAKSPKCDCIYETIGLKKGGCRIIVPPPAGYKCQCAYNAWKFACRGTAIQCINSEVCPADCTSRKCCLKGAGRNGNCDGYLPYPKLSKTERTANLNSFRICMNQKKIPSHQIVDQFSNGTYYKIANLQWNKRFKQVYPIAYFLPLTTQQVQAAVRCGVQANITLTPNSGGHSYESLGFGKGDSIIIDFRNMKAMSVDKAAETGKIQPGALVGPINAYLWDHGFAVPMGNCLTVGMGGHVIGGGIGYYGGLFGLALDNVLEMTVVDAKGNILTLSEKENSDLFWAMRGVGVGYFAIVTEYKFKLFNAKRLTLTLVKISYPVSAFAKVYESYQRFMEYVDEKDPTVFSALFLTNDLKNSTIPPLAPGIEFQAVHLQDPVLQPEDSSKLLIELRRLFPDGVFDIDFPNYIEMVMTTGYAPIVVPQRNHPMNMVTVARIDDQNMFPRLRASPPGGEDDNRGFEKPGQDYPDILAKLTKEMAAPRYFKAKSFFIKKRFTMEQMAAVGEVMNTIPQNNIWIMITGEHGGISKHNSSETAYVHRDSLFDITIHHEGVNNPEDIEAGKVFQKNLWKAIQFMDGGESYQNYVDLDDKDHLDRFYGSNLERLEIIKAKYDPLDYFHNVRSIPLRSPRHE